MSTELRNDGVFIIMQFFLFLLLFGVLFFEKSFYKYFHLKILAFKQQFDEDAENRYIEHLE